MVDLEAIQELIRHDDLDSAESKLAKVSEDALESAQIQFLKGYLRERRYETEDALDYYEQALETDPNHRPSLFRMSRLLSQRDEDEWAIELLERCVQDGPAPLNAMMNLAVLYEEEGRFEQARQILVRILDQHPNHTRARALLTDIEASIDMYYDEETDRVRQHRSALMDTPISEFELSVRSRNCLRQMDINTLGDLLQSSEAELLAYKNFGETSLNEIKRMLDARGFRLGHPAPVATEEPMHEPATSSAGEGHQALLNRSVAELELSVRSRKCLQRLGISSIGELVQRSEPELLAIKNFGQTSLLEIKRRLTDMGLSLAQR